ncbi:MAG: hypothetical protein FWD39_02110 [Clostridiales bacterium]|nr:hypothetical protein [Clostridiales bacterium]
MADISLIQCLYAGTKNFCIWYSDDKDGLFCNEDKKILCFSDKASALHYLSVKNLCLYEYDPDEEIVLYDFDKLKTWINSDDSTVNCREMLNFWNIFTDIAYSTGKKFKGDKRENLISLIYDKLFWGNNLPAVKPEDEEDFIPIWDKKQIKTMKSVMKNGLNIFSKNIICVSAL